MKLPKARITEGQPNIIRRILAFLIGMAILNFIVFIPFQNYLVGVLPKGSISEQITYVSSATHLSTPIFMITSAMAILTLVYFIIMESKFRQTVGKMMVGIYVISDTKKIQTWQLIVRSLFVIPLFPFITLWVIDPLTLIISKDQRRLSEIITKTRVVQQYSY